MGILWEVLQTGMMYGQKRKSDSVEDRLNNLTLKTMSVMDDRVSIHYQHQKMPTAQKVEFIAELNRLAEPGKIEFFAG